MTKTRTKMGAAVCYSSHFKGRRLWEEKLCKHCRWRGLVGGDYRKIVWNVLSCCFASIKVRWDILLNTAVLTDAVHHIAHICTQSVPVYIILLSWGQYLLYSLCNSVSVLRLQTHPNCAVGIWCKSNFVQVRIKYVDTVWICVYVHARARAHTHRPKCVFT